MEEEIINIIRENRRNLLDISRYNCRIREQDIRRSELVHTEELVF